MRKTKATEKIKQMFHDGNITLLDPESGYKYKLCALCPNDNNECSVTSFEKAGAEESEVKVVTFYCPICGNRFDALPEQMFLW